MKNIHILPTDKPSKFVKDNVRHTYYFYFDVKLKSNLTYTAQNIYITSDEVIKEGERGISINNSIYTHYDYLGKTYGKKIILTTDQDLIKDGVQEIPEYFLIHYIVGNNPIEYVEIKEHLESLDTMKINYEIIIPKEETKKICIQTGLPCGMQCLSEDTCNRTKSKQETLEEAAERLYPIILEDDGWDKNKQYRDEWIKGAKWQQKNNKEEVIQLVSDWTDYRMSEDSKSKVTFKKWFEQFKKK